MTSADTKVRYLVFVYRIFGLIKHSSIVTYMFWVLICAYKVCFDGPTLANVGASLNTAKGNWRDPLTPRGCEKNIRL